jgi:hypothetical protein
VIRGEQKKATFSTKYATHPSPFEGFVPFAPLVFTDCQEKLPDL